MLVELNCNLSMTFKHFSGGIHVLYNGHVNTMLRTVWKFSTLSPNLPKLVKVQFLLFRVSRLYQLLYSLILFMIIIIIIWSNSIQTVSYTHLLKCIQKINEFLIIRLHLLVIKK